MTRIVRTYWPFLFGILMFVGVSYLVNVNIETLQPLLGTESAWIGMALYVLVGIVTVMVPFGSLLPFMPLAVSVWGWVPTAVLTVVAWTLGSQLLFEVARRLGKPFARKVISPEKLKTVKKFMDHHDFVHSLFLRMFVHGDIVAYAFGIFTHIGRWRYMLVTFLAVIPTAVACSYFGKLPVQYQIGGAFAGVIFLLAYNMLKKRLPSLDAVANFFERMTHRREPRHA